jgi:hypothetical protein
MSDLHRLPLLGHDLPSKCVQAVVYKRGDLDWAWLHACPGAMAASGGLHATQAWAFVVAERHVKRCC